MSDYTAGNGTPVTLRDMVGMGGQSAPVFSIAESPDVAVKLFVDADDEVRERLQVMTEHLEAMAWSYDNGYGIRAAWPVSTVLDRNKKVVGYAMSMLDDHRDLYELAEPEGATGSHAAFDWGLLLEACARLAQTVQGFHNMGVVVGDLKPSNVLIDPEGRPTIIDCDSFGFTRGKRAFPSALFTEAHTAPERLTGSLSQNTIETDRFALSALIAQCLTGNVSPFLASSSQLAQGIGELQNLASGNPIILTADEPWPRRVQARLTPAILSRAIADLRTNSKADAARRTSAGEWADLLWTERDRVKSCDNETWHRFVEQGVGCPWCVEPDGDRPVRRRPWQRWRFFQWLYRK